jgi:thiamine pyrophosphate-dependent acetolactate synthase large subunit-like protein
MWDAGYGKRIGIDPRLADFVKPAEAFDVPGIKLKKQGELKPAFEKALGGKEPFLIEPSRTVRDDQEGPPDHGLVYG